LLLSVWKLTQAPEHWLYPLLQVNAHEPLMHVAVPLTTAGHALHEPQ
jgi:hypothetical protein